MHREVCHEYLLSLELSCIQQFDLPKTIYMYVTELPVHCKNAECRLLITTHVIYVHVLAMKPLHSLTLLVFPHGQLIPKLLCTYISIICILLQYAMRCNRCWLQLPLPIIMQLHIDKFFLKKNCCYIHMYISSFTDIKRIYS